MSGKLEIILCCNAALKRLPITMRQSALTVKLLNCQSGYQKSWVGGMFAEVGGGGQGSEKEGVVHEELQIDQYRESGGGGHQHSSIVFEYIS